MGSPTKILLSGSSGFVGGRFKADFSSTYEIETINLRTSYLDRVSFAGISVVVHCAALVHQMQGADPAEYFRINTELTVNFAKAAKKSGVRQFVFLSTAHVYGDSGGLDHSTRLTPSSPCSPLDPYGKSKLSAEEELQQLQSNDFYITILRAPMVYGEGAKGNLPTLVRLIRRLPILPFGYKENRRSLIYVGNLAHFIHLSIQSRTPGVLLPQDSAPLSIQELSLLIAQGMNKKKLLFSPPSWTLQVLALLAPSFTKRLYGTLALDSHLSNRLVGYSPPYSTARGIELMIEAERKKSLRHL